MNIRRIIREELRKVLNEYEIFDYRKVKDEPNMIQYRFNTDGLEYMVNIWHNPEVHEQGTYELGFGFEGQEGDAARTGKNLEHMNSVLYTVDQIVDEVVKDRLIRKINFSGARGTGDSNVPFIDPLRLKAYLRFVKNKYPGAKIDKDRFGQAYIDMRTIYPEIFKGKETPKELVVKELQRISDLNPDDWRIEGNILVNPETDSVGGEIDSIESSKYGDMRIAFDSNNAWKEHSLEWEIYDSGEEGEEYFNSFDELLNFLKTKFPSEEKQDPRQEIRTAITSINDVIKNIEGEIIKSSENTNDEGWQLFTLAKLPWGNVEITTTPNSISWDGDVGLPENYNFNSFEEVVSFIKNKLHSKLD